MVKKNLLRRYVITFSEMCGPRWNFVFKIWPANKKVWPPLLYWVDLSENACLWVCVLKVSISSTFYAHLFLYESILSSFSLVSLTKAAHKTLIKVTIEAKAIIINMSYWKKIFFTWFNIKNFDLLNLKKLQFTVFT